MRKRLFYFFSWTFVVLGVPLLGIAIVLDKLGGLTLRTTIADNYLAYLARFMLRLTGSAVQVEGLHHILPSEPVLFVSNHQGHFDSAVILAHIRKPKAFVASSAASKFPIFRIWFAYAYTIYLEIGNARQNYTALDDAKGIIGKGRSVVIYPEGVISSSPNTGDFKRGAFRLAFETGVPIVPLVIDGTWKVMGAKNDTIQPATITLKILQPVPTRGLSRVEQKRLAEQIHVNIESELEAIQAKR